VITQLEALVELVEVAESVAREAGPGHERLARALRAVREEENASAQLSAYETVLQAVLMTCEGPGTDAEKLARVHTLVRDGLFVESTSGGSC